jgi:hypothetical protein
MNKLPYILGVIAVLVIATVIWVTVGDSDTVAPTPSASPVVSGSPQSSGSPVASAKPTATPQGGFIGLTGLKEPASCTVGGTVEFLSPTIFSSKDAKITWKNVDIQSRQIRWKVSPNDALTVGPNLFASLPVPDGSEALTVGLPAKPTARSYKLTASVTYGQLINGNAVVKEAACTGSVAVRLKY